HWNLPIRRAGDNGTSDGDKSDRGHTLLFCHRSAKFLVRAGNFSLCPQICEKDRENSGNETRQRIRSVDITETNQSRGIAYAIWNLIEELAHRGCNLTQNSDHAVVKIGQ